MLEKNYNVWIVSILFAFSFVYIIPWVGMRGHDFVDVKVYILRIVYLHGGGNEAHYSGMAWLTSEPLWKYIIITLGNTFSDPRMGVYFISFLSLMLYSSFLFRRVNPLIAMLLLLNPMIIDMIIAQIRIALAFGLILMAYDLRSRWGSALLIVVAFLIHASMPVFLGIYYILYYLNGEIKAKKIYLVSLALAIALALFMKYGMNIILTMMGDRHAGYEDIIKGSTLSYSLVWILMAMILATFATYENDEERMIIAYAITIMSFYFFASALGVFGKRYVTVTMPFIIIAIGYLPKHYKQGTYLLFFLFNIYTFKLWMTQ